MKFYLRLVCLSILFAWSFVASASQLDFKANVLDPLPPISPTFPTYIIDANPFTISFSTCLAGELPNGLTADGCFAGLNSTGADWTSLEMLFPNDMVLASQPVDCSLAPSDNIFKSPTCTSDAQQYTLIFANGVLSDSSFFFITETGVPANLFPLGVATFSTSAPTPEPSSFLLLATGLGAALTGWKRFRL